ncbi:MAG: formylglycine-generating enzyme family protein, partial [Pirellulales bacterium]
PDITVTVDKDVATFRGVDKQHEIKLTPGEHGLTITRDGFTFDVTNFELKNREGTRLKIEYLEGVLQVTQDNRVIANEKPKVAQAGGQSLRAEAPPPAIAPFDATQARKHQEAWAKHLGVPVEYTNSLGMKFVLIPPGEFTMGSPPSEIDNEEKQLVEYYQTAAKRAVDLVKSQGPQHRVILTQPFYFGVFETTQSAYESAMGINPSSFAKTGSNREQAAKVAGLETANFPAEMVSWYDTVELCNELSEIESHPAAYVFTSSGVGRIRESGYRLPTEAEWEFACRAGTTTRYWFGDDPHAVDVAGWSGGNSGGRPRVVGQRQANPFGLYDTLGNVSEWCHDFWGPAYYEQSTEAAIDPRGPESSSDYFSRRSLRGGDWLHSPPGCSSSARAALAAFYTGNRSGCRLALAVESVRRALAEPPTGTTKPIGKRAMRIARLVSRTWPPATADGDNALAIDRGGL